MKRIAALCALALLPVVLGADWPQYRGPEGTGISKETGLLEAWPDEGPQELWRKPLGNGFSGISVEGDRLYTLYASGGDSYAISLAAADGSTVWKSKLGSKWEDRFGDGPRATPTLDGEMVYTLTATGKLHALRKKDGSVAWHKDLKAEYGARIPQWGISSSPIVEGKALLVNVGGKSGASIVAFDKTSGSEMWKSGSDPAGYALPLPVTLGGVRQVVFFTAKGLIGVAPESGKELWRHGWETPYDVNAATPIFVAPDMLFLSTGYDIGAALLKISGDASGMKATEVWRERTMKNQFSSSILHDGYVYGFDDKILSCIDVKTGENKWKARGFGHGSLLLADDHLIVLGDKGKLALVAATPEGYSMKSETQLFDGKTWTVPTLADGRLLVRDENEIVALKVGG